MAETAAGSEEPVVEQPAAGGADQPGQDLQNQDGEALGDGKVIYLLLGINCYIVDCRERWLPQAVGALGSWEGRLVCSLSPICLSRGSTTSPVRLHR